MTSAGRFPPELDNLARGVADRMFALPTDEQTGFLREHVGFVDPEFRLEFSLLILEKRIRFGEPPPAPIPQSQMTTQPQPSHLTATQESNFDRRFFKVGCALSVFVAVLFGWAFALGDMTPDQRTLMRVAMSLASGFIVGSFVGSFTVKTRGFIPGAVGVATGGFAVWILTAFFILPAASAFGVVVQPHGPRGALDTFDSGTVVLQIGEELKLEQLGRKGQAHFTSIPSEFEGREVPVRVTVDHFEMSDPHQKLTLRRGDPLLVPMVDRR